MLAVRVSWAEKIWALPFLTVLAPSEKYHKKQNKEHKTLSDWARQLAFQLKRWLPNKQKIIVGDGSYAVIELLAARPENIHWIVRLRLDAANLGRPEPPFVNIQVASAMVLDDHIT